MILREQNFPFYLRRSTYIHLALLSLTLMGGKIVFEQQQKLREKNMELVQASVRVDMVAMPKYTLNELKNLSSGVEEAKKEESTPSPTKTEIKEPLKEEPVKAEPVKEEPAKAEPIKEEPKPEAGALKSDPAPTFEETNKIKRQSFLSKLKQIGNKKIKSEGSQKAEKGLYGEKATNLKNLVMAGNKLNKGTAMYGDGKASDLTAFQVYASRLPDLVRPHWRLPSFLMGKKLKCRIRVWLSMNGEVSRADVYQSSGDNEYDKRAIEAIKAAAPFPKLSEEFAKRGQNGDIALGFPL